MLENTLAIVLAGGVGARLYPLTADRAKPAVPFGGKYRIVDFTLANCVHSGLRRILVLTQYKSHSLQKHLRDGWSIFNPEFGDYITPVPPQMRTGARWYDGTADAIYQNLYLLERSDAKWVLILSGDHIYRMDYAAMLRFHRQHNADLTVSCVEGPNARASGFPVVGMEQDGRVRSIHERPQDIVGRTDAADQALVSMGIYAFSMDLLVAALQRDHADATSSHDFGRDVVPVLASSHAVFAYRFGGIEGRVTPDRYWADASTLDSYYEANMELLEPVPRVNLYQKDWPIRTYQGQHPPARTVPGKSGNEGIFINSIIAGGTVISGGAVQRSILFPQVFIGDSAVVEDSILFEGVALGEEARLRNCIVDKYLDIPPGERIGYDLDRDRERFSVSEGGVVVVPKGYRFQ
jgi:glucose-1-phosphate adenylyltransferase